MRRKTTGKLIQNTGSFYIILVNEQEYSLPKNIYSKYNLEKQDNIEGYIVTDRKKKRVLFEPIHPVYNYLECYDYKVIDFKTFDDQNYIIVEDVFKNEISVRALKWQTKENYNKLQNTCKVSGFLYGKPILNNIDYFHPLYKTDGEYDFKFIGFKEIKKREKVIKVIVLEGEDNCFHEVSPLPSQFGHKFNPKTIKCKVIKITNHLHLTQSAYKDFYYSRIEDIINDSEQISLFHNLKDKIETDANVKEFYQQYEEERSFWTITLCNKVLPKQIFENAELFNIKQAILYTKLLLNVEHWILKGGILDSLKKNETRRIIKLKTETAIKKYSNILKAFICITKNKLNLDSDFKDNIFATCYYLRFNKLELIDEVDLIEAINTIGKSVPTNVFDYFEDINYFIKCLDSLKNRIKSDETELDFIIGVNYPTPFENNNRLLIFLKITFYQVFLFQKIGLNEKQKIYASEFFKYLSFTTINEFEKNNYLKLAFSFISNPEMFVTLENCDLLGSNDVYCLAKNLTPRDYNVSSNPENFELPIIKPFKNCETITVKLTKKERYGFNIIYNDVFGILPMARIRTGWLKSYPETDCSILLSVNITSVFREFNFFLAKEADLDDSNHLITNLLAKEAETGDIVNVQVKSVEDYGVFLTSLIGEGLLHKSNITDLFVDVPLSQLFKVDEELYACIIKIDSDKNKIEFGLKQLQNTEYAYIFRIYENRLIQYEIPAIEEDHLYDTNFDKASEEKELKKKYYVFGHIFEYFSNLQESYIERIDYLQLSQIYYSAIYSERSYFLNTYIKYFSFLSEFEKLLESKQTKQIYSLTDKAKEIYVDIKEDTVSLKRFPSIFRLLYFLDIINRLLKFSQEDFDKLYCYSFDEEFKAFPYIQRISKIVLANNLISSEKENELFIFKNLDVLHKLLKQGIFVLDETAKEKKSRALKERIQEIKELIKNEESDKLEFKSSLITPVLDDRDRKKYNAIKDDSTKEKEVYNLIGAPAKKRIIHSAMKTLVAFANSNGGTLFIGVDDNGSIIGLDNDYKEIRSKSKDAFRKKFDEYVDNYIGNYFFSLLSANIESVDGKDIFIIDVKPSESEVFLLKNDKKQNCTEFYIRRQSSSVKLTDKELLNYYKTRYKITHK